MQRRITLLILLLLCLCAVSATGLTCVQKCVMGGEDPICCRYLCHPIGMNPC
jgi:hypothetical protein